MQYLYSVTLVLTCYFFHCRSVIDSRELFLTKCFLNHGSANLIIKVPNLVVWKSMESYHLKIKQPSGKYCVSAHNRWATVNGNVGWLRWAHTWWVFPNLAYMTAVLPAELQYIRVVECLTYQRSIVTPWVWQVIPQHWNMLIRKQIWSNILSNAPLLYFHKL